MTLFLHLCPPSYDRVAGDAGDSPLAQQRGSENQATVGVFLSYALGYGETINSQGRIELGNENTGREHSTQSIGADRGWVHARDIRRAFSVLGELMKNPNRTDLVGEFIGSLTGPSADRLFHKVWSDPVGRRILQERRDLRSTLANRTYLASLPAGSFGRAYFDWTSVRDFTADGLADEISNQVGRKLNNPRTTMGARVVDMHDLWHVLNSWDSDVFGEIHLLGYSYAQLGGWAWLILGLIANGILATRGRFEGIGYFRNAVRRGHIASLLVSADWEAMLPLPLDQVRRQLSIAAPEPYQRLQIKV